MKKTIVILIAICSIIAMGIAHADFSEHFSWGADGWTPVSGSWSINDGQYCQTVDADESGEAVSIFEGMEFDDFVFEVDIQSDTINDPGLYNIGVVFRYEDFNNYYYALFHPGYSGGAFRAEKMVDGVATRIVDNTSFETVSIYSTSNFKIEANGTSFNAYLNDNLITSWEDSSFNAGKIGLRTWDASACFDTVIVETLNDLELSSVATTWESGNNGQNSTLTLEAHSFKEEENAFIGLDSVSSADVWGAEAMIFIQSGTPPYTVEINGAEESSALTSSVTNDGTDDDWIMLTAHLPGHYLVTISDNYYHSAAIDVNIIESHLAVLKYKDVGDNRYSVDILDIPYLLISGITLKAQLQYSQELLSFEVISYELTSEYTGAYGQYIATMESESPYRLEIPHIWNSMDDHIINASLEVIPSASGIVFKVVEAEILYQW